MTTTIDQVLDLTKLEQDVATRLVTKRYLAGTSVAVFNYTARAVALGAWTTEHRRCRGLVVDEATGEVLARPFEKFFDLAHTETAVASGMTMEASEKIDGSLGILFRRPDAKLALTTRGDPNSPQAKAASVLWHERYGDVEPPDGVTWLFEIILPENRIVVDYGERRDLVALAAIDIDTGRDLGLPHPWPGPVAERFDVSDGTIAERLAEMARAGNAEGLVVHWPDVDLRAKVKLPEYVERHRLIFGTSTRTVFDALVAGHDPVTNLDGYALPDSLRSWVADQARALQERHDRLVAEARSTVDGLAPEVRSERRLAAETILATSAHPDLCFLALDGRLDALSASAWRKVRPTTTVFVSEDKVSG